MVEDARIVWQRRVPAVGVASISISVFLLNDLLALRLPSAAQGKRFGASFLVKTWYIKHSSGN